jgi:hypothetical protein
VTTFTKQTQIMHYTETVFFKDGEEIAREVNHDGGLYDTEPHEAMTEQEIEDYS